MSLDTLLVANRGEIARRIFRTARSMGIRCAAVFVEADEEAPFVSEADESIRLDSYLNAGGIVAAAKKLKADAIHPGYGFLAENARFASAVEEAGVVWIGPSPEIITTMGDKLAAKDAAKAAGVPTLGSSPDPTAGEAVGYPLLVKAVAGGGGKGMHIVEVPDDLAELVAAARREADGAFGDDRVFLERYLPRSHHVEIQILGDNHGNLVHLGERECSIQRRHQKIIEESPSPSVDEPLRKAMGDAALTLARSIGYRSAGTVEFLLDDTTREFFFLEVNTRLQVEHPVTEEVTGLDLVREQIRIAIGEPLSLDQQDLSITGHAIEARLYAEDPKSGFLPASGTLAVFAPSVEPAVRWDSGVATGSTIGVDFDPMLAKVIAHGRNRTEAASRLSRSLERLHLGGVTTNRDFLIATLRHEAFLTGETTTDFIERHQPSPEILLDELELERAAATAAMWLQGHNRRQALVLGHIPSGWRNARLPDERVDFSHQGQLITVAYRAQRDGSFLINGAREAQIHQWSPTGIDLELGGQRATVAVTQAGDNLHIQSQRGTVDLDVIPRFKPPTLQVPEGSLVAPMPGLVLEVRVAVGDQVTAGETLVVLEAMKMEHHVKAPRDGTVADILVAADHQVPNGAALLVVNSDSQTNDEATA
ncbi:MAG: biotin carboxylase N-terminal domain-containing protein [Actinomycetota bacterium]|nr:biotin carboxylase N-terminal domain-containing protein [Actinomycetota bacterium]